MKYYLIIATALLLSTSCTQNENTEAKREKDSLMSVINERNNMMNEFLESFNDVEKNLDSIAVKQNIIAQNSASGGEMKSDQKTRINQEIAAINNLMIENSKKITELNRKLKNSSHKNVELEKAIVSLNQQLVQKNEELTVLNEKLNNLSTNVAQLQTSVEVLTIDNTAKSQAIAEGMAEMHKAYYIVGESKKLKELKLIDKSGGLLGIGKTTKLTDDFDKSQFTQIDYTQSEKIPVDGQDIKIITNHPTDSYKLVTDTKDKDKVLSIDITNPDKFWSTSKYLVVVKD